MTEPADSQVPSPAPSSYAAKAVRMAEAYARTNLFSGSVLVAHEGRILLRQGFGLANREWNIANAPDTVFRIGSVTKQFTAAAVLQLVERGKLGLDDPVSKHYAGAPAAWSKITICHLLAHASGIPSYSSIPDFRKQSRTDRTPDEIIALTRDMPLNFEPGTRFEYNNSGYILLGHMIETISGQSYRDYLQANIFDVIGIRDTGYDDGTRIVARRAAGYRTENTRWRNAGYLSMTLPFAAGGLYSTVDDLLVWDQALYTDTLIGGRSREAMFANQGHGFGFGWALHDQHGHRLQLHGGSINGFSSVICRYPDDKLTVIVLANLESAPVKPMASNLAAICFGLDTPGSAVSVDPKLYDGYVGCYRLGPNFFISVMREDGTLYAEPTRQPRVELIAQNDREFVLSFVDARIIFEVDAMGQATGLIFRRNEIDLPGRRVDQAEATAAQTVEPVARQRREVAIDPRLLDLYAGQYQVGPKFILSVTREGGGLFTQATGQGKFEIFPESEKDFFVKQFDAQMTFESDGKSRPTRLILHQGGLDVPALRID